MERLGGVATLGILNQEVLKVPDCKWGTKTPFASIRRIVQLNPNIYKIKPGLYGLVSRRKEIEDRGIIAETEKNKTSKDVVEFNHSYYQGLILTIGNLKELLTFVPNQDKNKKFLDKRLSEVSSLRELPQYTYSPLVKRSSTIDAIWLNQRKMPHSFFEVEHSTDIQNSLLKFNDLQDFHVRMVIVADRNRRLEYESKIKYSSFSETRNRVKFIDYESLNKQYEALMQSRQFEFLM